MRKYTKSPKKVAIEWIKAADIKKRLNQLIDRLELKWVQKGRIFCYRSYRSSSRAYARIWGFSRLWQMALNEKPAYIIEVLAEKFDGLSDFEKDKVLLHELSHIPKNFSGSLVPHFKRGKRSFDKRTKILIEKYSKER